MTSSAVSVESYRNLIQQLDDLVGAFENHPDERVREQSVALLSGLDALHRIGFQRLIEKVRESGGEDLLKQAANDPIVEMLLTLYDLAGLDLVPISETEPAATTGIRWVEVGRLSEVLPGTMKAVDVESHRVLLVNVAGQIYGYQNVCPGSNMPLHIGRLEGELLLCPWHSCRYRARTGDEVPPGNRRLQVLPVAVRGDLITLASR